MGDVGRFIFGGTRTRARPAYPGMPEPWAQVALDVARRFGEPYPATSPLVGALTDPAARMFAGYLTGQTPETWGRAGETLREALETGMMPQVADVLRAGRERAQAVFAEDIVPQIKEAYGALGHRYGSELARAIGRAGTEYARELLPWQLETELGATERGIARRLGAISPAMTYAEAPLRWAGASLPLIQELYRQHLAQQLGWLPTQLQFMGLMPQPAVETRGAAYPGLLGTAAELLPWALGWRTF